MSEQTRQQSERVIGQYLVHKGLLSFQCFDGAAGGQCVGPVQLGIEDLRIEFRDRKQAVLGVLVAPVARLAQNELAVVGIVPDVQPVKRLLESGRPGDCEARGPRIHTGDQDVHDPIGLLCEVTGGSVPLQTPEEVQPIGNDQRFVQADLRLGERLPHTVGGRDAITVYENDVETRLPLSEERLVDIRQAAGQRTACSSATHHCNAGSRTPVIQLVIQGRATGLLTRLYLLRRRSLCLLTIVIVNREPIFSNENSIFSTRA